MDSAGRLGRVQARVLELATKELCRERLWPREVLGGLVLLLWRRSSVPHVRSCIQSIAHLQSIGRILHLLGLRGELSRHHILTLDSVLVGLDLAIDLTVDFTCLPHLLQ